MKNLIKTILVATVIVYTTLPVTLNAHCQVPCGIYNDSARLQSMLEDAATVEKAARLINELAPKKDAQSQNQLVRWVNTKEQHAQSIIETISNYYLTQRVKTSQSDYSTRLEMHHAVIVAAMKTKQNVDKKTMENLSTSIKALSGYYPEHKH